MHVDKCVRCELMPAVNTCTDLLNDVYNLVSYNVNSLKWTGDCFYGLEAFIEALTDQVICSSEVACVETCIVVQSQPLLRLRCLAWSSFCVATLSANGGLL